MRFSPHAVVALAAIACLHLAPVPPASARDRLEFYDEVDSLKLTCPEPTPTEAADVSASPRPLYDDPERFKQDVERAFHEVQALVGMPRVELVYEADENRSCGSGAWAASSDEFDRSSIHVCPKLRYFVANLPQAMFVMAHEFGHIQYQHQEKRSALIFDLKLAWAERYWSRALSFVPGLSLDDAVCPALGQLAQEQELQADQFAVDAMLRADPPVNPANYAFVKMRTSDYMAARRMKDGIGHPDRRLEAKRIMDRVPDWIKTLPSETKVDPFQP